MTFRDREKRRIMPLKPDLFIPQACQPGLYNKKPRDFCLPEDSSGENLHSHIRGAAIEYFEDRGIPWHGGKQSHRAEQRVSPYYSILRPRLHSPLRRGVPCLYAGPSWIACCRASCILSGG